EGQRLEVRLESLVQEAQKMANNTFLKSIQVLTRIGPGLWPVLGDPTQLYQVILNLAVNARDAMPHGGVLTVSAENLVVDEHDAERTPGAAPGPHVLLELKDTGVGMAPEVLDRIFEPFFSTKSTGHGTGLGLSTAIGIVRSHGGFMRTHSEPG